MHQAVMNQDKSTRIAETSPERSSFFGHPAGLTNLFFTEMWERFSYYGMRAILILYMAAGVADGGLGFPVEKASTIYGVYTMLVYMGAIPGGLLADRFCGAKRAVLIGGIIIAAGHFTLAFHSLAAFYSGLALIVLGTALLKPNISAMVGSLYAPGDQRKDSGFSIFYMGINIGAFTSPLVCGWLAQSKWFKEFLGTHGLTAADSWHFGFAAAGVGMLLGLVHYVLQSSQLQGIGERRAKVAAVAGSTNTQEEPLTKEEWARLGAIGVLFFFAVTFWAVYEQGGTSLNLFADRLTNCVFMGYEFPSSWLQSMQALFVITLAPVFSWLWIKLGDKQPSSPAKFTWGLALLGLGISIMVPASMLAAGSKVSMWWLVVSYFFQVAGELCLSPVGLSTCTKLAPVKFVGMTMGIWFLASSLGNLVAGRLGGFFDEKNVSGLAVLFGSMGGALLGAALLLFVLTPPVKRLMSGVK